MQKDPHFVAMVVGITTYTQTFLLLIQLVLYQVRRRRIEENNETRIEVSEG